jgi:hypothetical protein
VGGEMGKVVKYIFPIEMQDSRCDDAMGAGTLSTQQQSKQQEQKVHGNKKSD